MSASSLMGRTTNFVFLLVGLASASAHCTPVSHTKQHREAPAAVHAARSAKPLRASAHSVPAHSGLARSAHVTAKAQKPVKTAVRLPGRNSKPQKTAAAAQRAHRATPDEVGRAAGLKIREQLARREQAGQAGRPRLMRVHASRALATAPARELKTTHAYAGPEIVPDSHDQPDATGDRGMNAMKNENDMSLASDWPARRQEASFKIPRTVPALRGSIESLARQNERLEAEGLSRIQDEDELKARIEHKLLVPLPASDALDVNPNLEMNHRYCRPWTASFLDDLAKMHEGAFHKPIEVSSAVRTVAYQQRLMRTNGNAAPAEGDIVSPHITGATIDIVKKGMSRSEINWMRQRLLALQSAGKIDVEEEFQQACFHITVYKAYAPHRLGPRTLPSSPGDQSSPTNSDQAHSSTAVAQGQ